MSKRHRSCPDCEKLNLVAEPGVAGVDRREFLWTVGAATGGALVVGGLPRVLSSAPTAAAAGRDPESLVKKLSDSFREQQRKDVCFAWDYVDKDRGLLRTRVSNNWQITKQMISSGYYTKDQQEIIRAIWEGIIHPDWHQRVLKQLQDDAGGYGKSQSIAIFGKPGNGKFELVMTGRHMTLRCDGNSAEHVAFGGPIFYGHAASGFDEKPQHPGNVYWEQAVEANKIFAALDGKQREKALLDESPEEDHVAFRKDGKYPGLPVADMTSDQKELVQKTLQKLIEPYRQSDRDEAVQCLKAQGGIDKCSLAFYKDSDYDKDSVWDNWRLEGPSFVWYFRGEPHVHVWVNVAADASVKLNAQG